MFDANKDGRISTLEIKELFASPETEGNDNMLQEVMSEVDKNNDNFISYEEFNDAMTEMLKRSIKVK